jgi:hypothetical protein
MIYLGKFMKEIKFSIEDQNLIAPTDELLAIEGMTGNYAVDSEDVKKEPIRTTEQIRQIIES